MASTGQRTLFSNSSNARRSAKALKGSRHLTHQQSSIAKAGAVGTWASPGQASPTHRVPSLTAAGELSGKVMAASLTAAAGELTVIARTLSATGVAAAGAGPAGELSVPARAASVTAGPIRWGRLSSSNSRGHNSAGAMSCNSNAAGSYPDRPRGIRACHQQLLSMLGLTLTSLPCFLPQLQAPVAIAVLDTLQCIMDTLARPAASSDAADGGSSGTPGTSAGHVAGSSGRVAGVTGTAGCTTSDAAGDTAEAAWQLLSTAQCVQRRLQAFRAAFDMPTRDELYQQMCSEHAEALGRAAALVDSLQAHCVRQQLRLLEVGVCSALGAADWGNVRPAMKWAKGAVPAVRLWQVLTASLVHGCVQVLAPVTAAHVLGQVGGGWTLGEGCTVCGWMEGVANGCVGVAISGCNDASS